MCKHNFLLRCTTLPIINNLIIVHDTRNLVKNQSAIAIHIAFYGFCPVGEFSNKSPAIRQEMKPRRGAFKEWGMALFSGIMQFIIIAADFAMVIGALCLREPMYAL
ncbi:MAG: hypothetical protein JXN60_08005 [Lentisphaerae bacterium]|nr:hypothetical protein [Lentisphaerota bacterium]